ncbi:MAG: hypothetical protein IJI26_07285 [Clostridia bacterium]|nr:hypothetical protein [Clostridia bacterium]
MKKLLAVLLALVLALSCTLAMAETTQAADTAPAADTADAQPFPGLTIESEYDVDRDTLKAVLGKMGMDESIITIIDTIAAIVDQTGEKVVIANEGFQAEVLMKGNSLLNLVGLANDKGLTFGNNLIPNYALDLSFEELGDMIAGALQQAAEDAEKAAEEDPTQYLDMASLSQVVTEYFNDYMQTITTDAIIPGTPEQGEFEQDGATYNTRIPMDISLPVILDATKAFISNLENDETVQTALLQLALSGVNVNIEDTSELDEIDPATLPAVKVETYMTLDDNGNQSGPTQVSVYVVPVGETTAATTVITKVDGNNVKIDADFVSNGTTTQVAFASDRDPQDPFGTNSRMDVYSGDQYFGCAVVTSSNDESIRFDAYGYLQDTEKPVITESGSIVLNGALTLGVSDSATKISLADLTGDKAGDVLGGLMNDLSGGAVSILMTAYSAVPEIGAIVGQLMGGDADAATEPAA